MGVVKGAGIGAKMKDYNYSISRMHRVTNQKKKGNTCNQIKESADTKNLVTNQNMVNIEAVASRMVGQDGRDWLIVVLIVVVGFVADATNRSRDVGGQDKVFPVRHCDGHQCGILAADKPPQTDRACDLVGRLSRPKPEEVNEGEDRKAS